MVSDALKAELPTKLIKLRKAIKQMARNWSELSSEEKREVFERLHKLYEDNGKPDKLKVSGTDEIVNILNAG